jgi:hypothetical protein
MTFTYDKTPSANPNEYPDAMLLGYERELRLNILRENYEEYGFENLTAMEIHRSDVIDLLIDRGLVDYEKLQCLLEV